MTQDITGNTISVIPVIPPAPHVLGDSKFVATLAEVENQVSALRVADTATAQLAASLQVRLTRAKGTLEATRKTLIQPFLDAQRLINKTAEPVVTRIDAAISRLKASQTAYDDEQQRIAAKLERERRAELDRLEKIRLDEEAAAARKAKEIAEAAAKVEADRLAKLTADQKANEAELGFVEDEVPELPPEPVQKTETEQKIEALKYAPVVVAAKPVGVAFRVTLRIKSIDVMKLPEVFVERKAKENAIRAAFCVGFREGQPMPVCEGCVFEVDKQPISTGREQF
jgi:hypothetical protein